MFGNVFGNIEEQQKEMRQQLANITVEAEAGGGAIKVVANANRQIMNIAIDKNKLDWEDSEQVEDLLLVAINRVLELAAEKEAAEAQNMLKKMMPPGMGDLSNLFG
ncbi:MAG: YbaB/EbfC family nucleoid-associated protein [Saprospiraceae bacterium]|nr:YbaB/EbfC family nucleoid-associated protein [Saprospiraceae bacterium]